MPDSTPANAHSQIKLYNSEDWMYEDFVIGQKDRSIRRTISEDESMLLNSLVPDMHPYFGDEEFAKGDGEHALYAEHLQTVKYRNPVDWVSSEDAE